MDFHPRLNMLLCTCINPGNQKLRLAGELRRAALRRAVLLRAVLYCCTAL